MLLNNSDFVFGVASIHLGGSLSARVPPKAIDAIWLRTARADFDRLLAHKACVYGCKNDINSLGRVAACDRIEIDTLKNPARGSAPEKKALFVLKIQ